MDTLENRTLYTYYPDTYELAQVLVFYSEEEVLFTNYTEITCELEYSEGFARIFDPTALTWSYVEDNKGFLQYNRKTKEESYIDYLGEVDSNNTLETPPTPNSVWDDGWQDNKP